MFNMCPPEKAVTDFCIKKKEQLVHFHSIWIYLWYKAIGL